MNTNSCVARTIFLERETMHRNLTTNSFAIAKHDKSSIFLKMFAKFLLSIILAISFQSIVLAENAQDELDRLGSLLNETTYGKLSFYEIQKHPKREEILAGMKRSKEARFLEWEQQMAQESLAEAKKQNQEAQERRAEGKKQLEEAQERNAEKKKLLVQKYTLYIGNAEVLGKGSKKTFNDIINFEATPEALKQRTRALIADKNMKWED